VDIRSERDLETVRQVAILLLAENQRLHKRLQDMAAEVDRLRGTPQGLQLELELQNLEELLAQREKALFGRSSEKRPRTDAQDTAQPEKPPARKGHGPTPQPRLPVVEQSHALPETERTCSVCGGELKPMSGQAEESEEITVVKRRFVVVKHRREKYRCACNANVVTAPAPPRLIPGGRYSLDFAVEVAAGKYLDHLPLERQASIMRREGLEVNSQTLWDQLFALYKILAPTHEALGGHVLQSPLLHADETHWPLSERGGEPCRHWAWLLATAGAACYRIQPRRSAEAGREVLKDYGGIVMADGYGAYEALSRGQPGFTLAHCWAHVRRKFVDAEEHYPQECQAVLDWIGQLYAVERLVPFPRPGAEAAERGDALDLRARLREERSKPIVESILRWVYETKPRVLPQSSLGKAISYMAGMWEGLTRFLKDPRVPLDNNHAERALRGVVIGRKNHYGSRSLRGTQVAALFYSLFETAKLRGVEPKAYVRQAAAAALATPGTVTFPAQPDS